MSTTYSATNAAQPTASTPRVSSVFKTFWAAAQEWRKWERLKGVLCNLSDRELMDIGIARGEINYVASNRDADPRGIRSSEWLRYLPTVDGHVGATDFR
ncbi:hypothetical protein [uncultured Bradyrhizobium sp.]|jgi:uncharacterized protein YjiS (DUF1127 family)|uniref:DUF1127 domain-containing protein n=1 Tax=uncultured Bradyrhizobium sp. TaxID=199684 RepID=UPI00260E6E9D|nr:hypothetical protein [uncultured Bradyrhizobium sp.]